MRQFFTITFVMLISIFSNGLRAEEKEELTYFYIENLSTETYKIWVGSISKTTQSKIQYACIPIKIIGVKKADVELLKRKLKIIYSKIQQTDLTQKEAESKCANLRKF
ncbi:MAG: hypothetical protein COB15_04920 [Flavobacteriales bacterium]|nr:MAG: hypothetical protein COB15_04920 [Flavobacteriales bacterium]